MKWVRKWTLKKKKARKGEEMGEERKDFRQNGNPQGISFRWYGDFKSDHKEIINGVVGEEGKEMDQGTTREELRQTRVRWRGIRSKLGRILRDNFGVPDCVVGRVFQCQKLRGTIRGNEKVMQKTEGAEKRGVEEGGEEIRI